MMNREISESLTECRMCPRSCGVDRLSGQTGICRAPAAVKVSLASLHNWEEPCISGENGSGAVFFTHCNLSCVFCQNYEISQKDFGKEVSPEQLSDIFLRLQEQGAHNINLVSPTHYAVQIKAALMTAKAAGLVIPIVYNSNGYDSVKTLQAMEGIIDIYLPDFKYYNDEYAVRYSGASDYFNHAAKAILEMYRQVGSPVFNREGLIEKGLIVRHLTIPGLLRDTKKVLLWISENLPKSVYVSLMSQYTPVYKAKDYIEIDHRLQKKSYEACLDYFFEIGLENGYLQELSSANSIYTPIFDLHSIGE